MKVKRTLNYYCWIFNQNNFRLKLIFKINWKEKNNSTGWVSEFDFKTLKEIK